MTRAILIGGMVVLYAAGYRLGEWNTLPASSEKHTALEPSLAIPEVSLADKLDNGAPLKFAEELTKPEETPDSSKNRALTALLILNWVKSDPNAALDFYDEDSSQTFVWQAWMLHDASAAIAAIEQREPDPTKRYKHPYFVFDHISREAPELFLKLNRDIELLPDARRHRNAIERLADINLEKAKAIVKEAYLWNLEPNASVIALAKSWAKQAPNEALAWAKTLDTDALHQIINVATLADTLQAIGLLTATLAEDPDFFEVSPRGTFEHRVMLDCS